MANPAPTINQINAFNATQGTTIDFNIVGGTELVRSNRIYIYDLSDNSLICTHLYVSTESIHELPANTDSSIVYESGKSSADFVNGAQYYAQIQTYTDTAGTQGGSGLSVSKLFWCLVDPSLTIDTIPSSISTTSYNVSATYNANTSVVSNIIQQYQFSLYSATGSLLQSSGVVVGNGEQQGTSTAYDISYNFTGLSVGSSYYVVVDVTTTQGMSVNAQSSTFTVSIDTPTLGEATVVNNACDGYISVTSNLSGEYGGSASGDIVSFETDSENVFTKLQVAIEPTQSGSGTPSPSNVRLIYGVGGVDVNKRGKNLISIDDYVLTGGVLEVDFKDFVIGETYTASAYVVPTERIRIQLRCVNSAGSYIALSANGYLSTNGTSVATLTVPQNTTRVFVALQSDSSTTGGEFKNIQLEKGATATEYEPYTETTVSQEFDVSLTPTSKDTDPYLFKAVGDIYGDRLEEELVGGSVVWNQKFQSPNFTDVTKWRIYNTAYGSFSVADNIGTITYSQSAAGGYNQGLTPNYVISLSTNHKYFIQADIKVDFATDVAVEIGTEISPIKTINQNAWTTMAWVGMRPSWNSSNSVVIKPKNSSIVEGNKMQFRNANFIDLTQMFGSTIADYVYSLEQATAGSGIAWLKSYGFFTKPYYEYDAGTLKSVNPTAHVTRGVNAWDEEWETGGFDASGNTQADSSRIRSKNFSNLLPNTEYYLHCQLVTYVWLYYYDANHNFISRTSLRTQSLFTTPIDCYYLKINPISDYGTTYNNDICINISNPTINGKYFPYEEHTYTLGDVTLRGIPKLVNNELVYDGDIYAYDGSVTRKYGVVDLGTLTWYYVEAQNCFYTYGVREYTKQAPNAICSKYPYVGIYADLVDKSCGYIYGNAICVRDESFNKDTTAFKTAMNGVMLIYELVTPTTETADPFEQIQEVSKYGTLEYITTNNVPVGHNTTYLTRDIFGGTLDLVSGTLVVDKVSTLFDGSQSDLGVSVLSTFTQVSWLGYIDIGVGNAQFISDSLEYNSTTGALGKIYTSGVPRMFMGIPKTVTSVAEAQAYFASNPIQVVYPLATPLTYQLTPQQIQTLVGVNNVWSEQGDIELSYHIPITNLLVKRQDVDDVSGNWLTLYSQPIEQASDMDFTFIDFLNQYGKTYKYALVPLLTQTQSGVEVEVEGGYTVSDEVQSIFDGVFISDSTGSQKCKANVGYGNVNMNQSVGSITPIGSQYPIIVTNSNNRYHNGSISGMIVPDDYYYNGNLSRIDMVNKRNELEQFLTNKRAKIIKDWNSNIWLVMIMDNIDCSFDNNYGMGIVTFNANWLEVGDPTNQEDLQATGLVDVGGV